MHGEGISSAETWRGPAVVTAWAQVRTFLHSGQSLLPAKQGSQGHPKGAGGNKTQR
jgi:hypothetical protein